MLFCTFEKIVKIISNKFEKFIVDIKAIRIKEKKHDK